MRNKRHFVTLAFILLVASGLACNAPTPTPPGPLTSQLPYRLRRQSLPRRPKLRQEKQSRPNRQRQPLQNPRQQLRPNRLGHLSPLLRRPPKRQAKAL